MRIIASAIVVLVFLGSAGCASVRPIGTAGAEEFEEDERRIWKTVEEEARKLDHSGALYSDAAVVEYLNRVATRILPAHIQHNRLRPQVKVLSNPLLNAFAYPNGVIYVHSGILASIENEAQLATLLGHELTHATHRHAIQGMRSARVKGATLQTFGVLTMPFGLIGALATALGSVGYMASVTGYSRDMEREADREGLALMARAGYAPEEAPKLFEALKREVEEEKRDEPFFFGSHPRLSERIESYGELLAEQFPRTTGEKGEEVYHRVMTPVMLDNVSLDLANGRLAIARRTLSRTLARDDGNARAHYLMGEVLRQGGADEDRVKAEQHYRRAVVALETYAEPYKALGLLYMKQGKKQEAHEAWRRYLLLAPQAPDRKHVEHELQKGQP
jgi:predicted Zn-dependent protease